MPRADAEVETPDWFSDPRFKKADLHCHSVYSTFKYFRVANTRDSYNRPEEVYRLAKERGVPVLAYGRHTDAESLEAAARAGADRVVPRSVFASSLPELILDLVPASGRPS